MSSLGTPSTPPKTDQASLAPTTSKSLTPSLNPSLGAALESLTANSDSQDQQTTKNDSMANLTDGKLYDDRGTALSVGASKATGPSHLFSPGPVQNWQELDVKSTTMEESRTSEQGDAIRVVRRGPEGQVFHCYVSEE